MRNRTKALTRGRKWGKKHYYNGEEHFLSEWAEILDMNLGNLRHQVRKYGTLENMMKNKKTYRKHKVGYCSINYIVKGVDESLCWSCNGGCEWEESFTPVDGWDADPTHYCIYNKKMTDSFFVHKCPKYTEFTNGENEE